MKDATRCGLTVSTKKDEKEAITDQEEDLFWSKGLMGTGSSNSLLNTVYFYNGKLFGLRGGEHRNITVRNIRVSDDCLRFEENSSKSFHGGICDLKYVPRAVTHICHERGQTHARCLVEVYRLYLGFCDFPCKMDKAFYFRPKKNRLGFDNVPVGINTLNQILPNMCSVAGIRKKTAHCLRVTCATSLFNAGVDEKLIRERTGHRSNALFQYEKANREQMVKVSSILGTESKKCTTTSDVEIAHDVNKGEDADHVSSVFQGVTFDKCNVKLVINSTNCDNM